MTLKDPKIGNLQTPQESPIMTSDTNKELKKRIKDISLQVLERNYKLYKALENKWAHLTYNSPYKTSMSSINN